MEQKLDMEHRLTVVEDRSKSNKHRLDELDEWRKDQTELISSVATLANEQKHIKTDVEEIKTDVKTIAEKPAKRWDGLVDKALAAIVGAFLAWILSGAPGI